MSSRSQICTKLLARLWLKKTAWILMGFFFSWGFLKLSWSETSTPAPRAPRLALLPAALPSKMREWRYIVLHHSGASRGNEEIIQADHLRRGMENGMAYHFLIGNGNGLGDGDVVEGRRWKYQLQGGHCHQEYLNEYGIGICLIGDFSRKEPTAKQVQSLSKLLFQLQGQFEIPDDNVHGHGQFFGEDSDCPGKLFPWPAIWGHLDELHQSESNVNVNHETQGK